MDGIRIVTSDAMPPDQAAWVDAGQVKGRIVNIGKGRAMSEATKSWNYMANYLSSNREERNFPGFVSALIVLLDQGIIDRDEARQALTDWGMRLKGDSQGIKVSVEDWVKRYAEGQGEV